MEPEYFILWNPKIIVVREAAIALMSSGIRAIAFVMSVFLGVMAVS